MELSDGYFKMKLKWVQVIDGVWDPLFLLKWNWGEITAQAGIRLHLHKHYISSQVLYLHNYLWYHIWLDLAVKYAFYSQICDGTMSLLSKQTLGVEIICTQAYVQCSAWCTHPPFHPPTHSTTNDTDVQRHTCTACRAVHSRDQSFGKVAGRVNLNDIARWNMPVQSFGKRS